MARANVKWRLLQPQQTLRGLTAEATCPQHLWELEQQVLRGYLGSTPLSPPQKSMQWVTAQLCT